MRLTMLTAAATALALAGCGESTPADYEAEPDPVIMPTPTGGAELELPPDPQGTQTTLGTDRVMQGQWFSGQLAGDPAALFGPPESEASFSVRCDDGELVFTRSAAHPAGATEMTVMAGGETTTIEATAQTDPLPQVTGRLGRNHPFADILATTPAPIAVAVADGPSFRMPTSDTLRQVAADCAT